MARVINHPHRAPRAAEPGPVEQQDGRVAAPFQQVGAEPAGNRSQLSEGGTDNLVDLFRIRRGRATASRSVRAVNPETSTNTSVPSNAPVLFGGRFGQPVERQPRHVR